MVFVVWMLLELRFGVVVRFQEEELGSEEFRLYRSKGFEVGQECVSEMQWQLREIQEIVLGFREMVQWVKVFCKNLRVEFRFQNVYKGQVVEVIFF